MSTKQFNEHIKQNSEQFWAAIEMNRWLYNHSLAERRDEYRLRFAHQIAYALWQCNR